MKSRTWTILAGMALAAVAGALLLTLGCGGRDAGDGGVTGRPQEGDEQAAKTAKEKKIEAARARLSPEDRALVDAQDYCAVMPKQKLGSMGVPLKVMIKGQPVFLCCKGCKGTTEDE